MEESINTVRLYAHRPRPGQTVTAHLTELRALYLSIPEYGIKMVGVKQMGRDGTMGTISSYLASLPGATSSM